MLPQVAYVKLSGSRLRTWERTNRQIKYDVNVPNVGKRLVKPSVFFKSEVPKTSKPMETNNSK